MSSLDIDDVKLNFSDIYKQLNERLDNQEIKSTELDCKLTDIKNIMQTTVINRIERIEQILESNKDVLGINLNDVSQKCNQPKKPKEMLTLAKEIKNAFLDCLSSTTGHGLPQIVKSSNLFLRILWGLFFVGGFAACCFMIYQSVDQFLQFGVITTTKIIKNIEITFPMITICSRYHRIHKMITECNQGREKIKCKMTNTTVGLWKCIQLNTGTDNSELFKTIGEDYRYGYEIRINNNFSDEIKIAVTVNNVPVAQFDLKETIYPGLRTHFVLSKTIQKALGPPFSECNETVGYSYQNEVVNCFNNGMSKMCGCKYPVNCGFDANNQTKICDNALNQNSSSIILQCRKDNHIECNQISYSLIRRDIYSDVKTTTLLFIYFERIETVEITQTPSMTITNLVSELGGLLGKRIRKSFAIK